MTDPMPPAETTPALPTRRRTLLRVLLWATLAWVLALPALLYLGAQWLDQPGGRAWLIERINRSATVRITALEGSLWRDFNVRGLVVDTKASRIAIDRLHVQWAPRALLQRMVSIGLVEAGEVRVHSKPQPPDRPTTPPPTKLTLPIAVHVGQLRAGRVRIEASGVDLKAIRARFDSDGSVHRLVVQQLRTPRGLAQAQLQVTGLAPFAAAGRLRFQGQIEDYDVDTDLALSGSLRDLGVQGRVGGERLRAQIKLRADVFAPYVYAMLRQAQLSASHVDPAALRPGWPQGDLELRLDLAPTRDGASGRLTVRNQGAGRLDAQRIPLLRADADFTLGTDWLALQRLDASLLGSAVVKAHGRFTRDRLQAKLTLQALDLAALREGLPHSAVAGLIDLSGPYRAPDVVAKLVDARVQGRLWAELGWIEPERQRRLALRKLMLARGKSTLTAIGEFGFERQDFVLHAQASHWNPADYAPWPAGDISGKFTMQGELRPQLNVNAQYALKPSRFNGRALAGEGRLTLDLHQVRQADLWLALGDNRVTAKGALGRPGDELQLALALRDLTQAGPDFSGRVIGQVLARGDWRAPWLQTDLAIEGFATPWGVAARSAQLKAELYPDLDRPFNVALQADGVTGFGAALQQAKVTLTGTRARHHAVIDAQGNYKERPFALALTADGALDAAWNWAGRWQRFETSGPIAVRLLSPAAVRLGPAGVGLADARFDVGSSRIEIARLDWKNGRLTTRGNAPRLAVAEWLALAAVPPEIEADLVLAGQWDLRVDTALHGQATLRRVSGDLRRRVGRQTQALTLTQFDAQLRAENSLTTLQTSAASTRFGHLRIDARTLLDAQAWRIRPDADLALHVQGDLPDLAQVAPLISDSVALAGALKLDVRRSGPLHAPTFDGWLAGSALSVHDKSTGIRLRDGEARLTLSERRIRLDTFRFRGGSGTLTAGGTVDLRQDGADAQAVLHAEQLLLVNRPDMQLVLSGKGEIKYGAGGISVSGNLRADRGNIEYRGNDVPMLSSDVVIVGRERQEAPSPLKLADLVFDVDLGENFRFRGYGLEAQLSGALRFRASPERALSASGVVKVDEGTYRAYGQKLDIERGILSFAGVIDNPGLDILAVRRGGAVEAGVQVKGSAQSPQVTLYSDPNVPDNEKLAWLLFGHGADAMDKGDAAVMVQALNAILTEGNPGEGFTDQFLETLGIDEVGFASEERADGTTSQVVSVSKRLGNRLRVALEKSFDGLSDAISLTVLLSRRWSLVTRFGTDESSTDMLYTVTFD
ncbi:translocation/assembly module TamB domain-containing protein [Chitiniphilus purpureus]|uniref:Translocation/assembly module TamB domain-containing protein n=1 Tax=Chitiniphilus purpureus TaxID=2981137 RepID=A0ABY6DKW5_9NEIS|nr:translocation/assembly module TamB domain-containing protein [Chitiniphilus sp. CD1]UXY14096.1 translocation/assembly module TamB domain-containing protein [Chitiniphilus sp. CD1]